MVVEKIVCNPLQENTYLLFDETKEAVIIDAGFYFEQEKKYILNKIHDLDLKLVKILNTHGHFDHIFGNAFLKENFSDAKFLLHENDLEWLSNAKDYVKMYGFEMEDVPKPDAFLKENDIVKFGNSELKVLEVPGHSSGSIAFYSEKNQFVIVGDVLFKNSIGRTDLPTGNIDILLNSIREKLFQLPDNTKIYTGHGENTNIIYEKNNNPFFKKM